MTAGSASQLPAQSPSEERKSKPARWHAAARRCKFYPWILLVQKYCSLNKGADVTAGIAIKEKNTKLTSTSRVPSLLCPQNGIRKSRASINEIMTYVSGSSFLYSSGFNFPKETELILSTILFFFFFYHLFKVLLKTALTNSA